MFVGPVGGTRGRARDCLQKCGELKERRGAGEYGQEGVEGVVREGG